MASGYICKRMISLNYNLISHPNQHNMTNHFEKKKKLVGNIKVESPRDLGA